MFLKLFSRFKKQGFAEPIVHTAVEKKVFIVYGHDSFGKGITIETLAEHGAEAIATAKQIRPDCRFNHSNLKFSDEW